MKKQALAISTFLFFQGCATAIVVSSPTSRSVTSKKIVDEDVINYYAYSTEKNNAGGLVFVGDKYTYLLKDDGGKLEALLEGLELKSIVKNGDTVIEVSKGDSFNGVVSFLYRKVGDEYSEKEKFAISKMCSKVKNPGFLINQTNYDCGLRVSGFLYKKYEVDGRKKTLNHSLKIVSNEEVTVTTKETKKVLDKLVALPFAIAFDVATSPLQAILFLSP